MLAGLNSLLRVSNIPECRGLSFLSRKEYCAQMLPAEEKPDEDARDSRYGASREEAERPVGETEKKAHDAQDKSRHANKDPERKHQKFYEKAHAYLSDKKYNETAW